METRTMEIQLSNLKQPSRNCKPTKNRENLFLLN